MNLSAECYLYYWWYLKPCLLISIIILRLSQCSNNINANEIIMVMRKRVMLIIIPNIAVTNTIVIEHEANIILLTYLFIHRSYRRLVASRGCKDRVNTDPASAEGEGMRCKQAQRRRVVATASGCGVRQPGGCQVVHAQRSKTRRSGSKEEVTRRQSSRSKAETCGEWM